ncbi:MAG: CRTAC1 family protein, partial [Bacteroidota bacterium]
MRRARPMLCVWIPALLLAVLLGACTDRSQEPTLFERLEPSASGVTFENTLLETAEFNIISYLYYFNGGGVAAGDVNDDGLPDLYFTANEGPNALYLNRTEPGGPVRFEDITEAAGVAGTSDWTTGVSMADVDGDGRLDLYVSALGGVSQKRGRNELFLNEGVGPDGLPRFREAAAEVGLDFEGYGTQSLFFDYDRDGDLDVYLLNHAVHTNRSYSRLEVARERDERSGDRLYRNVTPLDAPAGELPRFVEVTQESGIRSGIAGYGLAIVATDADNNGWPDIYVGNDFHENDFLYLNNGPDANGTVTFTEVGPEVFPHTSRFSMGVDAADLNGDGYSDFVVLDMLPRRADVRAVSGGEETRELAALKKNVGYHPQVARNTLQISRGPAPDGTLRYSDAAHFAGMEATDWSWASLLVDLDLDGHRDLFVTNGIWRRPNDLDFINYASGADIQRDLEAGLPPEQLGLFEMMPQVPIPNEAFRGTPGIAFEDTGDAWGLTDPGFSNGTATVDLDNDGDLDLVVNNINAPASVYVNTAADAGASSLQIVLEGAAPNTQGIGATVTVTTDSLAQRVESFPTRGYLSSVDPRLTVGLGGASQAKEVHVRWPDGRV